MLRIIIFFQVLFVIQLLQAQSPVKNINLVNNSAGITKMYDSGFGYFLFNADNGVNGGELWKSDGTTVGTNLLKDIYVGGNSAYPFEIVPINNTECLFRAAGSANNFELWKTNGTAAGTVLVKEVNPAGSSVNLGVDGFDIFATGNGTGILPLSDGVLGFELWISDGTAAGTNLLHDINPGASSSTPQYFNQIGNNLMFRANDDVYGSELRILNLNNFDLSVIDICENCDAYPSDFLRTGINSYAFTAYTAEYGRELWITDGTAQGTYLIKDLIEGSEGSEPIPMGTAGGKLIFSAFSEEYGQEIWATDGTEQGTMLLRDIYPGPNGSINAVIPSFISINGRVVFKANDNIHGPELWVTDGTTDGTTMIYEFVPGPSGSGSLNMWSFDEIAIMSLYLPGVEAEPYITDGTTAGTYKVFEGQSSVAYISACTKFNNEIFFTGIASSSEELWKFTLEDYCDSPIDECENAYTLTQGVIESFNNICSTADLPEISCTFSPGKSVWFTLTADQTERIAVLINNLEATSGGNFNIRAALFSGACGSLNEIACIDENGNAQFEYLYVSGLQEGETYYLKVEAAGSQEGRFDIYWLPSCEILNVEALEQSVCYSPENLYSQTLEVEFINPPISGDLWINGQTFPVQMSPMIVTLDSLSANNQVVDIQIGFTNQIGCNAYYENLFLSADACFGPCQVDLNVDGVVNTGDVLLLFTQYGCSENCIYDFDSDGVTATSDVLLFLTYFGLICE